MADRDTAFREALERVRIYAREIEQTSSSGSVRGCARAIQDDLALVLALYAERQGEEAVVTDGTPDGQYIELRFVQSTRITDGDKVRVSRIADGEKTI